MFRLLAIVALVTSGAALAAPKSTSAPTPTLATQWTLLAQDSRETKFFVDPGSIRGDRQIVSSWVMMDWPAPEKTRSGMAYQSKLELRQFNCASNEITTVFHQPHPGKMMAGKPLFTSKTPADFMPVQPDTVEESMLRHVCSRMEMLADTASR